MEGLEIAEGASADDGKEESISAALLNAAKMDTK